MCSIFLILKVFIRKPHLIKVGAEFITLYWVLVTPLVPLGSNPPPARRRSRIVPGWIHPPVILYCRRLLERVITWHKGRPARRAVFQTIVCPRTYKPNWNFIFGGLIWEKPGSPVGGEIFGYRPGLSPPERKRNRYCRHLIHRAQFERRLTETCSTISGGAD